MEGRRGEIGLIPAICQKLPESSPSSSPSLVSNLGEDIVLLFTRWNGLQMAVQNQWGGCDSLQKSQKLAADILSLLSQTKAPIHIEDLENLLHECLLLSFNTEIEDGSIEEVAEELMVMHEEYLQRNH